MKKVKRMFAKSAARPTEVIGSPSNPPVPPRERRSNTQRRNAIPEMETNDVGYRSVVDDRKHASDPNTTKNKKGNYFEFRHTWHPATELYDLMCKFDEIKNIVDNTGLCAIFKHNMPNTDRTVVEACIRRWWDTTHTFHLPTCEIGLTPVDFTMICGISVGGQDKVPLPAYSDEELLQDSDAVQNTMSTYFPDYPGVIDSGALRSSELFAYLKSGLEREVELSAMTIARGFIFFILGGIFFPNASNTCTIGWLNYLLEVDSVGKYDWGSAILARIYSSLDAASRLKVRSVNCFWQVIELFFYEHMATSCPLLIDPQNDLWPRMHRWVKRNQADGEKNIVRFNYDVATQQLEMRSIMSIEWQPYNGSFPLQFPANQASNYTSSLRFILLDPQTGGQWYLGDRCSFQVFGTPGIPANPPLQMGSLPRFVFEHYVQNGWPNAQSFVKEATIAEYSQYWGSVSRGPTLAPLSRGVNTDVVGYASLVGHDVQLPCTPHQLQGGVYDTLGASSSQPSIVDWSYQTCMPNGDIVTVPLERDVEGIDAPDASSLSKGNWRQMYIEAMALNRKLKHTILDKSIETLVGTQFDNPTQGLDEF